jgi:Tol biopolymer transport system component/DNA-binding winged helix-turn-helix (wHTH) protein
MAEIEDDVENGFLAGDWLIEPELNSLFKDGVEHHVEPKVMGVLVALARHPNHVVAKQDLIATVWQNTFVGDDVLTRCISILRRITEDDPHHPHFIQTVPKAGYRLVAPVSRSILPDAAEQPHLPEPAPVAGSRQPESIPLPLLQPKTALPWRFLMVVGFVIVLLVSLFLVWRFRQSAARASDQLNSSRMLQFTSSVGEQTQPAFSPDGTHIAFVQLAEDRSSRQIFLKKIGSETMVPLVPGPDTQFSPVWSSTGRQIAYLSRSPNGLGLYVADIGEDFTVKGPVRKLFIPQQPSHWEQGALSWSPDGRSLIFPDHSGSQPNSSIFQLDLKTLVTRSITSPPQGWEGDLNPSWSPDGEKIAFTRASETAVRDIYCISTSDGSLHQLTHDHMDIDSLTWSADSKSVIFSSNRGGKYALWRIGLNQSAPERLRVGTEDAYQPAVGPLPGQLAYTQGSAVWSIVRLEVPSGKVTPAETTILSSTQQDSAPSLSPHGDFFAMQSLRSGSQEIWISSLSGESLRQLTFFGGPLTGSPAWSHDGQRILFDTRPDTHSHIFAVPAGGGRPSQLTFGDGNDIIPRFSQDDATVYFRSNRAGRWQLFKMPTSGGEPQPITSKDGIVPQESPDGKYVYYARGDEDGLWRVPVAGGAEVQVLSQPSAGFWGYWQITRRGIFYLDRAGPTPEIRIYNPETKQNTHFATLKQSPPQYAGLTVSADGRTALITGERDAGRHITLAQPH